MKVVTFLKIIYLSDQCTYKIFIKISFFHFFFVIPVQSSTKLAKWLKPPDSEDVYFYFVRNSLP